MAGLRRGRKKRPKPIAAASAQTNLYEEDEKEFSRMVAATNKTRAELLRELVATGIRTHRLRAVGRDEAMSDVIDAQKSVVSGSLGPLVTAIREQKDFVEKSVGQMQMEYASIEERLKHIETTLGFILRGFDRILQNIVLIRALIWFYVFEFYFTLLHTIGKKPTREQLKKNYDDRVTDIKIEAMKERGLLGEPALEGTTELVARKLVAEAKNPPSTAPRVPPSPATAQTG